jgi:hypothetical protein
MSSSSLRTSVWLLHHKEVDKLNDPNKENKYFYSNKYNKLLKIKTPFWSFLKIITQTNNIQNFIE